MSERPTRSRSRSRPTSPVRAAAGGRGRVTAAVAAVGALVLASVVALSTSGGRAQAGELEVTYDRTSHALAFTGPTFDGQTFELPRGTPAVVNFYASWCTICDRELPDFQKVSQALDGQVQFVGVNPQSNDTDAAQSRMIERGGVTYPTVRDADDALLREFNTTGGLPTTLFVDGDGVVRKVHNGLLTEQALQQTIVDVLGVRA